MLIWMTHSRKASPPLVPRESTVWLQTPHHGSRFGSHHVVPMMRTVMNRGSLRKSHVLVDPEEESHTAVARSLGVKVTVPRRPSRLLNRSTIWLCSLDWSPMFK